MRLMIEAPRAAREGRSGPPAGPPENAARHLAIRIERQARSNWCWAAIAASLGRYYETSDWSQERVAQAVLDDRSGTAAGSAPNSEARLNDALTLVGCYSHWSPDRPAFARIRTEIDAGRPVCVRIAWRDGGSHFVVVTGYVTTPQEIHVDDPAAGPTLQSMRDFPGGYRGRGAYWRETYWTGVAES